MRVRVDTKNLKNIMSLLMHVVPKKGLNPMMGHIKISGAPNQVIFNAFDNEASLTIAMEAECDVPGSCTANALSLSELIKNLPPTPEVVIQILDEQKIQVSQSRSKYKFNSFNANDFPGIAYPNPENFSTINTDAFCTAIEKVEGCISLDEFRPTLSGVHFEPTKEDGFMRAVASDGNKLMSCKFPGVISGPFTISKRGVTLVKKILSKVDECGIFVNEVTAYFCFTGGLISVRLLNKSFPDYKQIIPKGNADLVVLPKDDLVNALKRTLLFVDSNRKSIDVMVTNESFDISSGNTEGSGSESIVLDESSKLSNPFTQTFSCEFLLSMVEKLSGETISIRHYGNNQPLIVHSDASTLGLLMPIRK